MSSCAFLLSIRSRPFPRRTKLPVLKSTNIRTRQRCLLRRLLLVTQYQRRLGLVTPTCERRLVTVAHGSGAAARGESLEARCAPVSDFGNRANCCRSAEPHSGHSADRLAPTTDLRTEANLERLRKESIAAPMVNSGRAGSAPPGWSSPLRGGDEPAVSAIASSKIDWPGDTLGRAVAYQFRCQIRVLLTNGTWAWPVASSR